jgi:hypothetical protein
MTVTSAEIAAMTYEERGRWLDALDPHEKLIVHLPRGYKDTLLLISRLKAWLEVETVAAYRLEALEALHRQITPWVTTEVLAAIRPADDVTLRIIAEAESLDTEGDDGLRSYKVLTSWEVFSDLCRLNPSLLDAIRMMEANPEGAARAQAEWRPALSR